MSFQEFLPPPNKNLPTDFMHRGNCVDVPVQFMYPDNYYSAQEAKAICKDCEVKGECLEYALTPPYEKFGVWGGTTEKARRKLRVGRRARRAA